MSKVSVGILGATSYTGLELIKRLVKHTGAEIKFLSSNSYSGQLISEVFGELKNIIDMQLISPDDAKMFNVDVVFSCLPHAVSANLLIPYITKGIKVIDLSADFRLKNADIYEKWYNHKHPQPELLKKAVYGLCEHYREEIKNANIIANPGCYPTSILLPLIPLAKEGIQIKSIIADSKSGVSGAGRGLKLTTHYVEVNDSFSAYSIGRTHRHISEIDEQLSLNMGSEINITFSPHLVPMTRGILSTIYIDAKTTVEEYENILKKYYENENFIRLRSKNDLPKTAYVKNTNFCDIAVTGGENNQPIIVVSTIDNLVKGASGQAIQNFNIMYGFKEEESLV